MNFRDLEYILQVNKTRNFSKAAEICHVSQPSLSAQIKKTEQELGTEIFHRSGRQISLSHFGEEIMPLLERILALKTELQTLAENQKHPEKGMLSLGAIPTIAPYLFPQIAQQVKKDLPFLSLCLSENKTDILYKQLLENQIDCALISLPTDPNLFQSCPLYQDTFYIAVSEQHPLAQKGSITQQDLFQEKILLLEEGHCLRTQALDLCYASAATENKMFHATSLETIRHFVATGDGVTLMPHIAARQNDGLSYHHLSPDTFSRQIGLIWRKTASNKARIEQLCLSLQNIPKERIFTL